MKTIDLRSDTVTKPTARMREAMASAEVGDDVYGEDPTVNRLEAVAAQRLGHEAALFVSSGTQSNLLGLLSHCERGDEFIAGQTAHCYRYEAGGAAVLGSIQPQPLHFAEDGTIDLGQAAALIKRDDSHFARTRLLCLENTNSGRVLPLEYLREAREFADRYGLGLHLDGARVFNAAVALQVPVSTITTSFDTVSVCLSKGLGAPVGSVLCGPQNLIAKARRWRKMVGGGMRQAGVIAAAGLIALEDHVERLAEDHRNADLLAKGLAAIDAMGLVDDNAQTNMVFAAPGANAGAGLATFLKDQDILVSPGQYIEGSSATPMRFVTHLDIDADDIGRVISAVSAHFSDSH